MKKLILALLLSPWAVCHASPSPSDSLHSCLFFEPGQAPVPPAAGKRLASLDAGEPRTVRMFYFLPNDRPYRAEVVQRTKDEMVRIQGWFGEQMEGHGHGYMTFRLETDDNGEPVVHRVDGRRPDRHYIDDTWAAVWETGDAFDLSRSIVVVVVDNSTNRINRTAAGAATWSSKESGVAVVGGGFAWDSLAHELAHTFGMGHDFRDDRYILSYGLDARDTLSECSAGILAVHPYFNPDVGAERGEGPAIELLSPQVYPAGSESVPIRIRVSDPDGLQQVRVGVVTRDTHDPRLPVGGRELKTCRGLMGEEEALVEIEYDGVIPSGAAHGFSDLSDPPLHPISLNVTDRDGNRAGIGFDLWELSRQHLVTHDFGEEVHGVSFARGGASVVLGSGEGVLFRDVATGTGTAAPLAGGVTAVAVSADGATLASGSGSGHVQLLDLEGGQVIGTLSGPAAPVRSLAFSPDGATLAWGEADDIHLLDMATRTRTATLSAGAASLAFSPAGAILASGSADGVRLWNVERRAEVSAYQHGDGGWGPGVNSVAFSPDGALVASGGDDTTVRVWEVGTDEDPAVLEGHGWPVRSVAFGADGTMLASGSRDLAVNLWDPVSGERLAELRGEGKGASSLAFSPDGRTLAAGTEDGRMGLWDLSDWAQPRPRRLARVSGDGQQGTIGGSLAEPLVVEVRDQYGNPLAGVEVSFEVVQGDGTLGERFTVERTTSDARGRAEAALTLGPVQGTNVVQVSVEGIEVLSFIVEGVGEPVGPRPGSDFRAWHLPEAATIRLGKGLTEEIAFIRNGQVLALATQVGIWLYDVATSREVALLPTRRLWDMTVSRDGRVLASCGAYKDPIRLWDAATGDAILTIDHDAWAVAFSPDGRTLASASSFGIELWDVGTGSQAAALSGKGASGIESLAFSPDGRLLAAGESWDASPVHLWDMERAARTATLEGHKDRVNSLAFSPDGRTLASASHDHTVKLWDVDSASMVASFEGHESWVFSVDFSPDGTVLASASDHIRLWDIDTGQATTLSRRVGPASLGGFVDFSPDGRMLAAGSVDGAALLEVATGNAVSLATGHIYGALSVALSPDGRTLASAAGDDEVLLWDVATGRVIATLRGHTGGVTSLDFSPDGATLASGSWDRTIRLWDLASGAEVATLAATGFRSWVSAVGLSGDGKMIASGHGNGTARVWDLATGEAATFEGGHTGAVESVALSPDGSRLATGGDGTFRVWDVASRASLLEREELGNYIYLSFDAAGTALALGADYGSAQKSSVWEVPAGADEATLVVEYPDPASPVVFSPDGSIFLAGGHAGTGPWVNVDVLEVRDVATAGLIAALEGHGEGIRGLAVSGDGSTMASASWDGTILVWDLRRVLPHPRTLTGRSGAGQDGLPKAVLGRPFVIEVRDQHGDLLEGAEVTFAVTGGGGTLSVETAATDARGRAAATLTLGLTPGPNTVEVTVGDLEPVVFTALTRAIPTTLNVTAGDDQQGPSGFPLDEPFVVALLDQAGGPLAGAAVTFAVTAGGGTLSVTRATTDARGRAATDLTLGRAPGANSVRATVAGLAPVTFTALGIAPTSDFDGDGLTGLSDFFLFAEALGGSDPRFDLDGDGSVDLADFFLFAEGFGPQERARLVAMARELIGLPDGPELRQNAPNPFNSQTVIAWFLPEPGPARLEVFALTGQRVAVLHQGPGEAGPHRLRWDGRDDQGRPLGSGVYVCRLMTSGGAQTRKLTLLR